MKKIADIRSFKSVMIAVAIVIALLSLIVSNSLVRDLSREERSKMEVFAQAYHSLNAAEEGADLSLVLTIITGNKTIPVIVTDQDNHIQSWLNVNIQGSDTTVFLTDLVMEMREKGNSIKLLYGPDMEGYTEICYDESLLLSRLTIYPYIQMTVVLIFVTIAIAALLSFKKTEQNRVWVGLSKETAHQLGTPISSLMAWTELLREKYGTELIEEMEKDVNRLQMIADRFSKIGSMPEPMLEDVTQVLNRVVSYMETRTPRSIRFVKEFPDGSVEARVCAPLLEWVVENLCKNAADAMDGQGVLTVRLIREEQLVAIELADTGKGLSKGDFKRVFEPGFTTKKRGWGLGLSLAKRIVEEYHKGRIFVKQSEPGRGTTFRLEISV